jgi:hypothetical protein
VEHSELDPSLPGRSRPLERASRRRLTRDGSRSPVRYCRGLPSGVRSAGTPPRSRGVRLSGWPRRVHGLRETFLVGVGVLDHEGGHPTPGGLAAGESPTGPRNPGGRARSVRGPWRARTPHHAGDRVEV